jgi:hypothetical protein
MPRLKLLEYCVLLLLHGCKWLHIVKRTHQDTVGFRHLLLVIKNTTCLCETRDVMLLTRQVLLTCCQILSMVQG